MTSGVIGILVFGNNSKSCWCICMIQRYGRGRLVYKVVIKNGHPRWWWVSCSIIALSLTWESGLKTFMNGTLCPLYQRIPEVRGGNERDMKWTLRLINAKVVKRRVTDPSSPERQSEKKRIRWCHLPRYSAAAANIAATVYTIPSKTTKNIHPGPEFSGCLL